jgi:hypothetical protein
MYNSVYSNIYFFMQNLKPNLRLSIVLFVKTGKYYSISSHGWLSQFSGF